MKYRKLGETDIDVSVVTFGAWAIGGWLWGGQDEADAIDAIHTALDAGITSFDTAAVYGFGRSEELLGKVLAGRRDRVRIFTKYGLRWDRPGEGTLRFDTRDNEGNPVSVMRNARPDSVIEECERSLKRLNTDYIDLYQCHWPDPTTPIEDTMGAIAKLIEQGKVRASGVSNYTVEQMERAHAVVPLAASQPPFSMVNRKAERDVIPWCIEHNVGVVPYSPLQRGLLTGKITEDYEFGEGDHRADNPYFRPENVRAVNAFLDQIEPIAERHNATLAQLVIAWTIARPGITSPLVGARNRKQARENAAAADIELSEKETSRINELLSCVELEKAG